MNMRESLAYVSPRNSRESEKNSQHLFICVCVCVQFIWITMILDMEDFSIESLCANSLVSVGIELNLSSA